MRFVRDESSPMLLKLVQPGVVAILLAAGVARGQASYPMLMDLAPLAARIGETSEHDVRSRYTLEGAYQVIVTGDGVTGEVVAPPTAASPTATPLAAPPANGRGISKTAAKTTDGKTPATKDAAAKSPPKASAKRTGQVPVPAKPPVPVQKA